MSSPKLLGENQLTAEQLVAWYRSTGRADPPSLERLVRYYLEIGEKEGVRGDIAFAQAVHETGFFTSRDAAINNFAGIGHPDGAASGMEFSSVKEGVQAHVQLLKKVVGGNDVELALPDRAPGWGGDNVERWSQLGGPGRWASDRDYWTKVSKYYRGAKDRARHHPVRRGGGRHDSEVRPWRIPSQGRTVEVNPAKLQILAEHFADHLAVAESVFHRCNRELDEIGRVRLADDKLENRLRTALHEAIEDWHGLRRLPYLLTKDVGYIVEVRQRVELLDRAEDRSKGYFTGRLSGGDVLAMRRTTDALITALSGRRRPQTLKRSQVLLEQLFRKDKQTAFLHRRQPAPVHRGSPRPSPQRGPGDVKVDTKVWGGSKSVFDQLVTPIMRRNGMEAGTTENGQRKRQNDSVNGPGMSDHYVGSKLAYATDYPTDLSLPFAKQDAEATKAARAVARAFHIDDWQPGSYRSYQREIDGHNYVIQILWKSDPNHYDHVHIGIHRTGQ